MLYILSNQGLEPRTEYDNENLIKRDAALTRALEEAKLLREQLRQSQKLEGIGTLAAGLVHDFNNILHVVQGYALALVDHEITPEQIAEAGQGIVCAVEKGTVLVRQLLSTASKSETKLEYIDVNKLLEPLIDFMTIAFPRTLTIVPDLDGEMPSIIADVSQINQALLNLCVNAKDAMVGEGKLEIKTRMIAGAGIRGRFHDAYSARYICISVADTGCGMEEEIRGRIFEPFFTTKPLGKGTGLGLSVTAAIVQSQNGFIDVQSEPGEGSTFHIYLPVPKQPDALARAAETFDARRQRIRAAGAQRCFSSQTSRSVEVNANVADGSRIQCPDGRKRATGGRSASPI
jgi:signal transduction histidine kinase